MGECALTMPAADVSEEGVPAAKRLRTLPRWHDMEETPPIFGDVGDFILEETLRDAHRAVARARDDFKAAAVSLHFACSRLSALRASALRGDARVGSACSVVGDVLSAAPQADTQQSDGPQLQAILSVDVDVTPASLLGTSESVESDMASSAPPCRSLQTMATSDRHNLASAQIDGTQPSACANLERPFDMVDSFAGDEPHERPATATHPQLATSQISPPPDQIAAPAADSDASRATSAQMLAVTSAKLPNAPPGAAEDVTLHQDIMRTDPRQTALPEMSQPVGGLAAPVADGDTPRGPLATSPPPESPQRLGWQPRTRRSRSRGTTPRPPPQRHVLRRAE